MATVGTFNVVLAASTGRFVGSLSRAERKWDRFSRNIQRQAKLLPESMKKSASASLSLARNVVKFGAVGVATMTGLGIAGIRLAANFEQTRLAFKTLLGSAEEGNKVLGELVEFTARTPFQFRDVTEATRQLLAFGFAAEEIQGMLTNLGDTVAAMGGTGSDLAALAGVFGKIRSRGRVTAQEMQQLTQRGIPAWEMLAEAIGTNIPGAMEKVSKGTIDAATAITAITTGMAKRFGGMMEVQSKTMLGRLSTLRDNLEIILRGMGEDIIRVTRLGERVDRLTETFSRLAAVVTEKGFIRAIREAFPPWAVPVIVAIAGAIAGALVPTIVLATITMTKKLIVATGVSITLLWKWALIGAAVAAAAYILTRAWGRLGDVAKAIWMTISGVVLYSSSLVISGVGAILTALSWIVPGLSGAARAVHDFATSLRQSAASAWTAAKNSMVGAQQTEAVAKSAESAAKAGQSAAKAQENFGEAVEGAGKKALKNLQPFDEINQLQNDIGAGTPEFDIPMFDLMDTAPIIGPIGAAVAEMGEQMSKMADMAAQAWGRLQQAIEPVNKAVQWIKDNWPTIGPIVQTIAGIITALLIPALIKTGIEAVIAGVKHVGAWLLMGATAIKQAVIIVAQLLLVVLKWTWSGMVAMANAAKHVVAWTMSGWAATASAAKIVIAAGIVVAKWIWMSVMAMSKAVVMAAAWIVALGPIAWVIATIVLVATIIALNWEFIKTKTIDIWTAISTWVVMKWEGIRNTAISIFTQIQTSIINAFVAVRNGISNTWDGISSWLFTKWTGIRNTSISIFTQIQTSIINAFVAVRNGIRGIWNGIWDTIKFFINCIIDGINVMIRGMNKVQFTAPSWVPVIGGKSFGINIPVIPKLATGTNFVPRDMLAYLHKGEAVVPRKYNPAAVSGVSPDLRRVVEEMADKLTNVMVEKEGSNDGPIEIKLMVDRDVLAKLTAKSLRELQRQSGGVVLPL